MINLSKEIIKGKKFYYNEKDNNIKYEEYIFNGFPIPNNIQIKVLSNNSVNISWDINANDFLNEKIYFKIEMKKDNDEFKEIYEGNENNYIVNNLFSNSDYEFRICSLSNGYKGPWSKTQKIKIKFNYFELDNSSIIKSIEEKNKLIEWISAEGKIKNIKLIYRATVDGDTSKNFFSKIKQKGPIISIVETSDEKRFGGFTKVDWKDCSYNGKIEDKNAFLFSLDKKNKYKILKPEIECYDSNTLVYGNNSDGKGIYLYNNFLKKKIMKISLLKHMMFPQIIV